MKDKPIKFKITKEHVKEITSSRKKYESRVVKLALEALAGVAMAVAGAVNIVSAPIFAALYLPVGIGTIMDGVTKIYKSYVVRKAYESGNLKFKDGSLKEGKKR